MQIIYPKIINLAFLLYYEKAPCAAIRSSMENFSQLENDGIDIIPLYAIANL